MEKYIPPAISSSSEQSGQINPVMVDKIADFVAQVIASKSEIASTVTTSLLTGPVLSHHSLPRQCSLPTLSLPYVPRTPPKESYTLEDFQCKHCHRPFFSKRDLTKHTETVHFMEVYKPSHWCSACSTSFSTARDLSKHMATSHEEAEPEGGRTCPDCFLRFQHPLQLSNHVSQYHTPRMTCSFCNRTFSDVRAVWAHLQEEHKLQPKEVKCNLCDAGFTSAEEYTEHCRSAHAFPCMLCDRSVEDREKLQEHLEETHNKHFCPDCADIFSEFEAFVQHYIRNDQCSLDPYKLICRYCNGTFPNLKLLFKHLCLDSFSCVFCGSSSISCKTFQSHLETAHNAKLRYINLPPSVEGRQTKTSAFQPPIVVSQTHRLVPSIVSDSLIPIEKHASHESNGSTASYIHNLIQVNETLLKSKPPILSKYSSGSSETSTGSQCSFIKNLCSNPDLMRYLQSHTLQSLPPTPAPGSVKTEPEKMDCTQDNTASPPRHHPPIAKTDSTDSLEVRPLHPRAVSPSSGQQSFSSLDADEEEARVSDRGDTDDALEAEYGGESRRNSLRQKYSQLSLGSRTARRPSKSLNRMFCKTRFEEEPQLQSLISTSSIVVPQTLSTSSTVTTSAANTISSVRSSFSCQRCNKTFVNRSLLSRHWGTATKCYICSQSMCDLKVLNEHMKSAHSEYSNL